MIALLLPCGCALDLVDDTPIARCAEAQRLLDELAPAAEEREHFVADGCRMEHTFST